MSAIFPQSLGIVALKTLLIVVKVTSGSRTRVLDFGGNTLLIFGSNVASMEKG
jgi:hypothetical protein